MLSFLAASKLLWWLANPFTLAVMLLASGMVMARRNGRDGWLSRLGRFFMRLGLGVLLLGGFTPLPNMLAQPLEQRFARPNPMPDMIAGVIILGGALDPDMTVENRAASIGHANERLIEGAHLARLYPDVPVVFTGGAHGFGRKAEEAGFAAEVLVNLGIARERLMLEGRSRNTHENALFTRDLVRPVAGKPWLFVTSAMHMPRAVGVFRAAGWEIIPYPVDYRARPRMISLVYGDPLSSMNLFALALREWIGLAAYRFSGRSSNLLPEPVPGRLSSG